jgi:hypothetical protein
MAMDWNPLDLQLLRDASTQIRVDRRDGISG